MGNAIVWRVKPHDSSNFAACGVLQTKKAPRVWKNSSWYDSYVCWIFIHIAWKSLSVKCLGGTIQAAVTTLWKSIWWGLNTSIKANAFNSASLKAVFSVFVVMINVCDIRATFCCEQSVYVYVLVYYNVRILDVNQYSLSGNIPPIYRDKTSCHKSGLIREHENHRFSHLFRSS